jgi:hypothetical protein
MGLNSQRQTPAALYPQGKDPRYPLHRRLGGPQSRSGHRGYRKNPLPLPGIEPRSPGCPARSQTLYWLSYPAHWGLLQSKKKSSPSTRHGGAWGERRYSSYSFMNSALDGGEWSASRPGRSLPPGKGPPLPIVKEAGWAPEPVWTQRLEEKSSAPAGDRTPIARCYIT